jgi:hypothetical protein
MLIMNNMRTFQFIIISSVCILLPYAGYAQNADNVLTFSENFAGSGGTARNIGQGGAFGALGADMSSLSINPAGIGVYRLSEFTFTPVFNGNDSKATLYNQSYSDNKYRLNINNIGYVYTYNTNKDEGWVSMSMGIAYNRLNDFNKNVTIYGSNSKSSLLDGFTSTLNQNYLKNGAVEAGEDYSQIEEDLGTINNGYYNYEYLAYETGAIYIDDPTNPVVRGGYFINDLQVADAYGEQQQRTITTTGGIGEYAFSIGANYSHKLYLGFTMGIDHLEYNERKVHTETNIPGDYIDNFTFIDDFKTWGTGINAKFGLIYRPVSIIRLGLAFHTPTFYSLSSEFYTSMEANYKQAPFSNDTLTTYYGLKTDISTYDYDVNTPWKVVGSMAVQFKQLGLLSVDYEYIDYSKAKIRAEDDPFTDVNDSIGADYRAIGNLRVGGEIKLGDFSLRAGYGLYGSPFKSGQFNKNASTTSYSGGFGYRGQGFYIDFAYVLLQRKYKHSMYSYEVYNSSTGSYDMTQELVDVVDKSGRFVTTLGFRF